MKARPAKAPLIPAHPGVTVLEDEVVWDGRFPLQRVRFTYTRFDGSQSGELVWELWRRHAGAAVLPYDPVTDSVQATKPKSRSAPSTPRTIRSGKTYTPSVVTRRRPHESLSDVGVNACGNNSDMSHRASAPPRVTLSTGSAGANSNNTCRQIPHGGVGTSASVAITRASNSLSPRATAAPTATRSAHEPAGYDAFSTLHPSTTIPFEVSSAAPTRKPE